MTITILIPITIQRTELKREEAFKQIQIETGCFIEYRKAEPHNNRPHPYIYINGITQKHINNATIKVQELILDLVQTKEKKMIREILDLSSRIQYLELLVADRELEISKLKSI